jgi:hypothetical protein
LGSCNSSIISAGTTGKALELFVRSRQFAGEWKWKMLGPSKDNEMKKAKICDIIIDMKPTFGHCGIVTYAAPSGPNEVPFGRRVLHATNRGVRDEDWAYGEAYCFRAKKLSKTEAVNIDRVACEISDGAKYGVVRAVFKSWSGSSSLGGGAFKRMEKYRTRMTTKQQIIKNVYCSELVVISYQLGLSSGTWQGEGFNVEHDAWIGLDGKHTLPSTLKTWLERTPTKWECVGRVTDASLRLS